MSRRHNGEGSIYPAEGGYRGYVWCTSPDGERYRKYVRGRSYDETQRAWLRLRDEAAHGTIASDVPKLAEFLSYWLKDIVQPNLSPKTYERYDMFVRLHITPHLGTKRLDKIQVKDIRQWLNRLGSICQCCRQGKDAARPEDKRRCCAINRCCHQTLSPRSRRDARDTLRAALACAIEEESMSRNPAAVIRLAAPRKSKRRWWTAEEARRFLEHARNDDDPLYAAYVLVLVLGLRRGEVLGLTWELANLDIGELWVGEQVQRVVGQLVRRPVKTESSEAPLPLPGIAVTALKLRQEQQTADRAKAGETWIDTGLVFSTRHGTPIEPRNFNRTFDRRITKAGVPKITVHGTRKTCGTLLAALDVHPRVAMQILRHSKIAVTMDIYTEVPSDATRKALKRLGRWLDT